VREHGAVAARVRGRFRRRDLLLGVLVVAVVSGLLLWTLAARPTADALGSVGVERAHVGTTYGFDGVVCLGSDLASSTVDGVTVQQAPGGRTALVRVPEESITLGFPVDPDAGGPVDGFEVPAGERDCTLRVLLTPDEQGRVEAGLLELHLRYGPFGLLRRTASVRPDLVLDVTETGPDPRAGSR
jgi:hypothetical protein